MPPHEQKKSWVLFETDVTNEDATAIVPPEAEKRVWKIVWRNVLLMGLAHIGALYGVYLSLFKTMWLTNFFGKFITKKYIHTPR